MIKEIYKIEDVRDKVSRGLESIAQPVTQTLGPKGKNVLFETTNGDRILTNDGITIAKNISVKDPVEDSIVEIVKEGSMRTNLEAGDGTTSTVLLANVLVKEGFKLLDEGYSWIEVRDAFNKSANKLVSNIEGVKKDVETDQDLEYVARISANNDEEIAKDVVDIAKTAGETGVVVIDRNNSTKTEVVKDLGFMLRTKGYFEPLYPVGSTPSVEYKNVPVLLTDTRLYYKEDCEHIIRVAKQAGFDSIVVVARDFIGESPNVFITNHQRGNMNILLVKDERCGETTCTSMADLALYLGGKVISEKAGKLVSKLTKEDFVTVSKVASEPDKTLFTPVTTATKELEKVVEELKKEFEKDRDNEEVKNRLAALTTGVVTVKIGGATDLEARERAFRYEDAVNATRAAMRQGYVAGGGTTILNSYKAEEHDELVKSTMKRYTEAILGQLATNCGEHPGTVINEVKSTGKGYNALTNEYVDLIEEGIIEPFLVSKQSILNSTSVANMILSIGDFVLADREEYENERGNKSGD